MTLANDFAGKYAAFIWPAYGVCVLVFAWMIVDTLARARHWRAMAGRSNDSGRPNQDSRPLPERTAPPSGLGAATLSE